MTRARNSANLASDGNLFVDIANDRTGIGSVAPAQNLHVAGTAGFHADTTFVGDLYNTTWDRSANTLKFSDNAKLSLGDGNDVQFYWDGGHARLISSSAGQLDIRNNSLHLQSNSTANYAKFLAASGVELYHVAGGNSKKFETTTYGTNTTGTAVNDGLVVAGVATVTTMNVTGVLTYDDVTSVDSVGIVTARQGVHIDDSIVHIGDTNTKIRFPADDTFSIETGGTQGVKLTSAQKLLVGDHTASRSVGNSEHILQTEGTSASENGISIYAFNNSAHAGHFTFGKSRNNSSVADNDYLGHIIWSAHDGTDANSTAARITGRIDGTVGSNTTPGSLEFYTTAASSDNVTLRTVINSSGHVVPGTDSTYDLGLTGTRWRNVYADTLYGDGSNLTGITQTTINNNANNRVITGSGTANTLEAESTLTYDASLLNIISSTQGLGLRLQNTGNEYTEVRFDAARTSAGGALGILQGRWNNSQNVCAIYLQAGDDTTNKDDGRISMFVQSASGSSKTALKIEPDASVQLPNDSQKLQLGNDQDLNIWHGGSNGYIDNETGSLVFRTTSSNIEKLRITSGGDMGLGTDSPNSYSNQTTFTINGTTYGRLDLEVGGTLRGSLWANSGGLGLDAGGNDIEMFTGSQQRVKINTSGQMGIGQAFSPSRHLDIKDSTGANRIVNIRGTGTSGAFLAFLDANTTDDSKCRVGSIGGNNIGLRGDSHSFQDGGGNNKMAITSGGCVNIGGDYTQQDDRLSVIAGTGFEAIGIGGTTKGIRFGWDGDRTAYDDMRLYFVDYSNSGTHGIAGNSPCFVMSPTSAPGSGIVQQTVWLKSTGRGSGNSEMNLMVDGDIVIGGDGQVPGASESGYPASLVQGLGSSKLSIQSDDRTTAFSASDGTTWHDVVLKQSGGATSNAIGIALEVSSSAYHSNAGTGIAAVKQGTNSDYGCDLAFITRPQSGAAQERMRLRSSGGLRLNNTDSNEIGLVLSNYDHGNHDYSHRNGRTLHSNGTGWDGNESTDGADPILVLSVANRAGNSDIGDAYGIQLHSESQDDNDYGPLIGWTNRSNSGGYNTTYAAIVGQKTGQATDHNWSSGSLHFFTNKPGAGSYMDSTADLTIDSVGRISTPRNPSFLAEHGHNANSHKQKGEIYMSFIRNFQHVRHNTGSCYNNSTGKFTAPVAGTYIFQIDFTMDGGNGTDDSAGCYFRVENNSANYNRVHSSSRDFHSVDPNLHSTSTGYEVNASFHSIEKLAAGATVGWYFTDWDATNTRITCCFFSGYKIG